MDQIREGLVNDFGRQYKQFGHSELMGRVVGLLLHAPEPMPEEEIAAELKVSKSPVNQITRRLEELNLVRRVRFKNDRKYYYEIAPNLFLQAGINLYRLYEENLRIADAHLRTVLQRLDEAAPEEREAIRKVCARLVEMREFHTRMIASYRQFIEEWRSVRDELPPVEEYARDLVTRPAPALL